MLGIIPQRHSYNHVFSLCYPLIPSFTPPVPAEIHELGEAERVSRETDLSLRVADGDEMKPHNKNRDVGGESCVSYSSSTAVQ